MATRTPYAPAVGEVLTAANLAKMAKGWIGLNSVTANQGSITSEADLTGLSLTVTIEANRMYKITGYVAAVLCNTADNRVRLRIKEGATVLQTAELVTRVFTATSSGYLMAEVTLVAPSAGSHTYKLTMLRDQGSGTVTMVAGTGQEAFILIEDIGPSS